MRRWLLALVLTVAACTPKPHYQGDQVLGSFAFSAEPLNASSCTLQAGTVAAPFSFTGVLSYDTKKQVLYLDTDGDTADDHTGTLAGTHFKLHGSADRDLGCGAPVTIDEVLEGDLFAQAQVIDGGCAAQPSDGGAAAFVDGGIFEPVLGCGTLTDTPRTSGDGGCASCALVFGLSAVRQ